MPKIGLKQRLRYYFDNLMSKGAPAMIAGLGVIFLAALLVISFFIWIIPGSTNGAPDTLDQKDFLLVLWKSFMRTLDPGTMGGDQGVYGIFSIVATGAGIFILSALIGILNSGIEDRLETLKRGRSQVIEKDHTVILGFTEQVFTIVSELLIANESRRRSCIVIMGEQDKVEMENALNDRFGKTRTRIICRQGNPIVMDDLDIVSLDQARSIIILSPDKENPDAEVIKTVLAITNNPRRKKEPYHIVAEIRDPKNMDIAGIVGKDELETVLVGDLISRIVAQTCRQTGLSIVYTELLDFGGSEIYINDAAVHAGKTYGSLLNAYIDSCVLGLYLKDGTGIINPPMDRLIEEGDQVVLIAEDESAFHMAQEPLRINESIIVNGGNVTQKPEATLILGWNWRGPTILRELDHYVAPGSSVTVVADYENGQQEIDTHCGGCVKNQTIRYQAADTTDRRVLDSLKADSYDHIILLSYLDTLSSQEADAHSLITLLHLRDISEKSGKRLTIVSEMQDIKNRDLAEVAKVNDFIISDKLISLILAQISENKRLNRILADIFDPDGSEIYLKPAGNFVKTGVEVDFATVVESARRQNMTAIGCKIDALEDSSAAAHGVTVNPEKKRTFVFTDADRIIVAADS